MALLVQHSLIRELKSTPSGRTVLRYYAYEKDEFNESSPAVEGINSSNSSNSCFVEQNGACHREVFEL